MWKVVASVTFKKELTFKKERHNKKVNREKKEEEELGDREERNGVKTEFLRMLFFFKYKINLRSSNL